MSHRVATEALFTYVIRCGCVLWKDIPGILGSSVSGGHGSSVIPLMHLGKVCCGRSEARTRHLLHCGSTLFMSLTQ